jgi:NhaP-type Na+/H+ or K+/H+ antiporter
MGPQTIVFSITIFWLIVAAVVIGYPLMTGRIRAGLNTFSREDEPRAFWKAYTFSTTLFLVVSIAAGVFLRSILHGVI